MQFDQLKRREFITLLGGAATLSLTASAQQSAMPLIGILQAGTAETNPNTAAAFRKGLNETGYIDGQTVAIEYFWAEGQYDQLPKLAAELVRRRAAAIITPLSTAATLAAKAATTTIPIVFSIGSDPVEIGLVASLSRPGGNVTGVVTMNSELGAKRLGLLQELLPTATRFAVLINPKPQRLAEAVISDVQAAAFAIGRQSRSWQPVPVAKSIRRLRCWCRSGSTPFLSAPTYFWTPAAHKSWCWLRGMPYP